MSKPEHVSAQDKANLTKFYQTIYNIHQRSKLQNQAQLDEAKTLLTNHSKFDDDQGRTLKASATQRIIDDDRFIHDLIVKCEQYLKEGKIEKFW